MKKFVILITAFFSTSTIGIEKTIELECEYTHSIQGDVFEEITGTTYFEILHVENNEYLINKDNGDFIYTGRVSDDAIYGVKSFVVDGKGLVRIIQISRKTGEFTSSLSIADSVTSLTKFGICKKFAGNLF